MTDPLVVRQPRLPQLARWLGQKQAPPGGPPGTEAGWGRSGGGMFGRGMPRLIRDLLKTYGGYDEGVLWVYACAGFIASELSGYPWEVLDTVDAPLQPDEVPEDLARLLDLPLLRPILTHSLMLEYVGLDLELAGNSYWLKDRRNALGQPTELIRLRPELVQRAVDNQGRPIGHVYQMSGVSIPYGFDEVLWYRYANPSDDLYGMGTVEAIQRELGAELSMDDHVMGFYEHGGRISGVVTVEGAMGEQAFARLQRQFEEQSAMQEGTDWRLLIVEQGLRFAPITEPPGNTGVVELRRMGKDRILGAFGVPEPLLGGVLENANYKITDSRYVFAERMRPKAQRVSEDATWGLVQLWDGLQYRLEVTVNEPPHERASRVKDMLGTGASLNQLLDAQGLPIIDDEAADEPLLLNTLVSAASVLAPAPPPAPPAPPPGAAPPQLGPGAAPPQTGQPVQDPSQQAAQQQRILAKRPRARGRVSPAHSRRGAGRYQERYPYMEQRALPPPPQQGGGAPLVLPPLPQGYEDLGEVRVKRADATVALRMLTHRHHTLATEAPAWMARFTDFFIEQRTRVHAKLQAFSGQQRAVRERGRRDLKALRPEDLWDARKENQALLGVYLPLVDSLGAGVLGMVGEVVGAQLRWDLQVPEVAAVRKRLGNKITKVNETTRAAVAQQVETGLARGYSVTQIANGVAAEAYKGVLGVFDDATRYRAEMIARSETAMVYNDTANAGYADAGVSEVEVVDGTGDDVCAAANGAIWTLEQAQGDPIGHPNCVRSFMPVLTSTLAADVYTLAAVLASAADRVRGNGC